MKKLSKTAQVTRDTFITAFCEIYKTKPIDKITVTEIATRAGYNRITFYEYFMDTRDLLEQIENEYINTIANRIEQNISNIDALENFDILFKTLQDDAKKYAGVLLSNKYASTFPIKLKGRVKNIYFQAYHIDESNIKAMYAVDFFLSGIISVVTEWQTTNTNMSVDSLRELIMTIFTQGVQDIID